jgi:hypothetical protein
MTIINCNTANRRRVLTGAVATAATFAAPAILSAEAADTEVSFTCFVNRAGSGAGTISSQLGSLSDMNGDASYPQMGLKINGVSSNGNPLPIKPVKIGLLVCYSDQAGFIHELQDSSGVDIVAWDGTLTPPNPPIADCMGVTAIKIIFDGIDKEKYTARYQGTIRQQDVDTPNTFSEGSYGPANNEQWMGQTTRDPNFPRDVWWFNSFSIAIAYTP